MGKVKPFSPYQSGIQIRPGGALPPHRTDGENARRCCATTARCRRPAPVVYARLPAAPASGWRWRRPVLLPGNQYPAHQPPVARPLRVSHLFTFRIRSRPSPAPHWLQIQSCRLPSSKRKRSEPPQDGHGPCLRGESGTLICRPPAPKASGQRRHESLRE